MPTAATPSVRAPAQRALWPRARTRRAHPSGRVHLDPPRRGRRHLVHVRHERRLRRLPVVCAEGDARTSRRTAQSQHRVGHLDLQKRIRLIPDLTWWRGGTRKAVIDAKYKPLTDQRFPNADAYQMLAYCTALGLDRGYLVYAKDAGEAETTWSETGRSSTCGRSTSSSHPTRLLAQVQDLAREIAGTSPAAASTAA